MAETSQTALEIKGFVLAVIAGILVVGLAFGISALVRNSLSPAERISVGSASSNTLATPTSANITYTAQMVSAGAKIYPAACASCHGSTATGAYGPNLRRLALADSQIAAIIKNGKGQMPAFGKQYSDAQINDIVGYLRSLK